MVSSTAPAAAAMEVPDCHHPREPTLVKPKHPTRRHTLRLSNLDDQRFLRFTIKYLYVYRRAPAGAEALRAALARALVDYYPLAGRIREVGERLELECNGEGAVFAEAHVGMTAAEFLEMVDRPDRSWRKLLHRAEMPPDSGGVPALIVQVTHLSCGGMILCVSIHHCVCDGAGSSQFLHAWSHYTVKPSADGPPVAPHHSRLALTARTPLRPAAARRAFIPSSPPPPANLTHLLLRQPLSPVSLTFSPADILALKRQCSPSLKCTSFDALAAHVWRNWARVLDLPGPLRIKLIFSVNSRGRVAPPLPDGFYGNGFVLGCAETSVEHLVGSNVGVGVRLVREAKEGVGDEYVRATVDYLEGERGAVPDLAASLVISQWSRLGLEGVGFGGAEGPAHVGPIGSEIYCLFLPVAGDEHALRVLMSVPERARERFERGLKDVRGAAEMKDARGAAEIRAHAEGEEKTGEEENGGGEEGEKEDGEGKGISLNF